jgi:hypothetical protein
MHKIEAQVGRRIVRCARALATASVVGLFAAPAMASTSYWLQLTNDYGFKGDCTVCHETIAGGADTVTKPFGRNLQQDYGVGGNDLPKFREALVQVTTNGLDSDGDGATDIEELSGGGNPNDKATLPGGFEPPVRAEYGCVGTIAGNTHSIDGAALTAAIIAALTLVFKRRR